MRFRWSCFVSHRLSNMPLAAGILTAVREALENELDLQLNEKVYVSEGELKYGNVLDPALALDLCRSACMIVLFTGKYFDDEHPYCAREYLAMTRLEAERLARLPGGAANGLIIPVVLRDLEALPAALRGRVWCDFTAFQQVEGGIAKPKAYFEEIRKLAEYIAARCRELRAIPGDDCREFDLPTNEEAARFCAELARG
jgi:TIR domain